MQPLTEHQRAIALEYLAQMDRAERISREAEEARNEAARQAANLVETFRLGAVPEVIVLNGQVIEISRHLLRTEHTHPDNAVRLVRDVIIMEDGQ